MPILEARNVSFGYGHGTPFEKQAVVDVSLSVEKGECVSVIGHTGSGKSTLMQLLNGLLKPETGSVLLDSEDINKNRKTCAAAKFRVGLCFQYPEYQLFGETCEKDIAFGPKNMGLPAEEIRQRVAFASKIVGLEEEKLSESPFDLSGGQKRRCAIAGVIAMQPEVLILDEPTAGLDPAGRSSVLQMIGSYREQTGAAVIIVTHSMEIACEISDRVFVLNHGELAYSGTPREIFSHSAELLEMGLDVPVFTKTVLELRKRGYGLPDVYSRAEAVSSILTLLKGGKEA